MDVVRVIAPHSKPKQHCGQTNDLVHWALGADKSGDLVNKAWDTFESDELYAFIDEAIDDVGWVTVALAIGLTGHIITLRGPTTDDPDDVDVYIIHSYKDLHDVTVAPFDPRSLASLGGPDTENRSDKWNALWGTSYKNVAGESLIRCWRKPFDV